MASKRLVDLEYHIPKEHKQEIVATVEEREDIWIAGEGVEHCSSCGRDSDVIPMVSLFYRDGSKAICLRCLKRALSPDPFQQKEISASSSGFSSMSEEATEELSSEPISLSGNPMSMFD